MSLKRVFLLVGLILVAALIGFGIYYGFRRARAPFVPPPPIGPEVPPPGVLPPAGERVPVTLPPGVVTPPPAAPGLAPAAVTPPPIFRPTPVTEVSRDLAAFPSPNRQGDLRYHNAADGKFYRLGSDGRLREMTDQVFFSVQKITWAAAADKAVLEYPDGAKIIYDFERRRQTSLPRHWTDFTWSPEGRELAAKSLGLAPENRWLVTIKDDGTGTRLIEPLGNNADRVTMTWSPSRQTVALSQTGEPLGLDRREVLFVGLNGENFKSTIVEGLDFQPQWSPTGERLLYSVDSARSDFKPELWLVDAYGESIGNNRRSLRLNTWANKCTFGSEDTLYCAVPRELPRGAGMAPEIATSPDDIFKIDLATGLRTAIPLGGDYQINTLSFTESGNKLFFTDRTRRGVFEVAL
ncbi:MAG: hypothetical protein HYV42_02470 [Candidatus Magasanikbacteria bacterium]|nr:hypothetical protein [Candidatus Magasanikbacteria bacterium]